MDDSVDALGQVTVLGGLELAWLKLLLGRFQRVRGLHQGGHGRLSDHCHGVGGQDGQRRLYSDSVCDGVELFLLILLLNL